MRQRDRTVSPKRESEIALYAKAYAFEHYRMGKRRRASVLEFVIALQPRGSLLDVGTGRGETMQFARGVGHYPVLGTEVVRALLGEDVTYAEAHALPFASASFDHVTCFDVLEHLTEPDLVPALSELHRVARVSVTASASETSSFLNGVELHISKRSASQWEAMIRSVWGNDAVRCGHAGASPCWKLIKPSDTGAVQ
jgi:ubiquinone/menaquinone biosynthesis C-methylase UbiE